MNATLLVQPPGREQQEIQLTMSALTIGRDASCDLVVDYRYVSRVHARLERTDSGYRLLDCASTNGTFVNGRRIDVAHALKGGDRIEIGDVKMQFSGGGSGQTTLLRSPSSVPHLINVPRGGLRIIVFTDVEGSTTLVRALGDIPARELLREHEVITRKALASHGGSEIKTMGDGFLATFPSVARALACAVAIQIAFEERNRVAESPFLVRVGMNAGEPLEEEDDLFGTAVIIAARVAQLAKGGEILVSSVVRDLAAGRGFRFAFRGDTVLKGFDEAVCLNELVWKPLTSGGPDAPSC